MLRRLRDAAPVHFEQSLGLWVVTRYDDVLAVLRDPETFASRGAVTTATAERPARVRAVLDGGFWPPTLLTETDPPLHGLLRRAVQQAFTPRRVAATEPVIRATSSRLVEELRPLGSADVVDRFAWPLPLHVIAALLGVPDRDVPAMHRWSQDLLLLLQATGSEEEQVGYAQSVVALQRYLLDALRERRGAPPDDLMGALARIDLDELGVTEEQMAQVPLTLLLAGHATVARAIGSALWLLLGRHAELVPELVADPALMAGAVEEILRLEAPAQGLYRTTTRDAEVAGVTIPAGAKVMVHFGAANRDERRFELPDELDPRRPGASQHLAFGRGLHFCIGAPLARLELPIALGTLLRELPGLRLGGGPARRHPVFFSRGFIELHASWDV